MGRENYDKIKNEIQQGYQSSYQKYQTSNVLAQNIEFLGLDDLIDLLTVVRDSPDLKAQSLTLSRRSNLFDKLVIMQGGEVKSPWILRLHTYNVMKPSEKEGYVISNLGYEIRDDENHIHEHSWQLASQFLKGGFRNHNYIAENKGNGAVYLRYNLLPTAKDKATKEKPLRCAQKEGTRLISEVSDEVYQQGDLVHYPIEVPHKVDVSIAPYVGMSMTLAHTSERINTNSIFYEKLSEQSVSEMVEVSAYPYSNEEHTQALDEAITRLKLMQLSDQLASRGFKRFNRFIDPLTFENLPNNTLETELLPTIAMIAIQGDSFEETPLIAEKNSLSKPNSDHKLMISLILEGINEITDKPLLDSFKQPYDEITCPLAKLIIKSQLDLIDGIYVDRLDKLKPDAQGVIKVKCLL
ncbi:hypothetical protein L3V82_08385 [Thiotrichales bacterium 19S3-7]|nr:hypothetical protein [Thiotrichales bacterium 19S3-7]MCF6802125.1 hypothetical protein [Thiotrichales bacterium 19S3-11]